MTVKKFTAAEIAAYNAAHTTPNRKVLAAQAAEAKLLPRKESYKYGEFPSRVNRGRTAEQVLQNRMLHGDNS
jgi:hypothetical protein